ncbi:MAG TPA: HAMP domain-containing sensor histidine kinase [Polyangia bacterium]|jgi:signal transduction histidine kinase|nr:HAMP domain-containing sensor histidine kinase [Polyangia bacterium]
MPNRICLSTTGDWRQSVALLRGTPAPGAHARWSPDTARASRDELLCHHAALLDAQREHRELTELIVHDLKAPLSALRAGLDWVRGHLPPEQDELVEAIADADAAARRLGAMIGDLLSVSRLDQSDLPLRRQSVSLRSLFDLIAHTYTRRAGEKGIALRSHLPPDAGDGDAQVQVHADPTLLQRVMENLVENALRYTRPNGQIQLSAARHPESRDRPVEIAVSNDGPPIPPPERARIFHKFARGSSEGAVDGSAGLGLYFCKRAVEAHGGAIAVVETPDWPTSFRITLP